MDLETMIDRTPSLFARACGLLTLLLLPACSEGDPYRGLPEFCQEVLPRVASYIGSLPQPIGDRYGGTLVMGSIGEMPNGMNALVSSDYDGSQHQSHVHLMTLLRYDAGLNPIPYLAESWEMNEEGTALTFRLRDDVRWHDGTPTTARDLEFTYRRAVDPETAFPNATLWTHYDRGPGGMELLDEWTVRVHLTPHAEPLNPWLELAIMPRHLLEEVPPAELRQHPFGTRCPVGNGPFVFEDHRQDASWSFVRNPGFPAALGGPPYLERYVYRIIPEQTTLLTELLTENIDFFLAPRPSQAPQVMNATGVDLHTFPFTNYVFVGWNTRRPQLADVRVRQAITLGTNRAEIVQALIGGYGTVANAGVPPTHWAHHAGLQEALAYDPVRAAQLLDEAGWIDRNGDGIRENPAGVRLEFSIKYNLGNQDRQDIAEIMQAQLRQIGIAVRPQVVEWATLLDQINTPEVRDFDGVVIGWVTGFKVDDHDLFHSSKVDQPRGWTGIQDPALDAYLDTLQLMTDREEAIPLWYAYQERLAELQPYTYLYFPNRLAGVNQRLQGVALDPRGEWAGITEWWIPADRRGSGSR